MNGSKIPERGPQCCRIFQINAIFLRLVTLRKKLGVTKGYVSQILNGDFNHRLSTLVDLSLAMGKAPIIQFSDLDKIIENPPHVSNSIHETGGDTPRNLKAS